MKSEQLNFNYKMEWIKGKLKEVIIDDNNNIIKFPSYEQISIASINRKNRRKNNILRIFEQVIHEQAEQVIHEQAEQVIHEQAEKVNVVCRKIEKGEFYISDGDVSLYDSCLRNIMTNFDFTSKYLITQYIKNKGHILSKELINEIYINTKEYYKLKKKYLKVKRCYRCYKYIIVKEFNYGHHIIPLECGGDDSKYNKVFLCRICHDYIELETLELIKIKKDISISELKTYIRTDFPIYEREIKK